MTPGLSRFSFAIVVTLALLMLGPQGAPEPEPPEIVQPQAPPPEVVQAPPEPEPPEGEPKPPEVVLQLAKAEPPEGEPETPEGDAGAACGCGFEVALLLPPLAWLRKRRLRASSGTHRRWAIAVTPITDPRASKAAVSAQPTHAA